MRKRTYQAVRVQQVRVEELLPLLVAGCIVALDVAKMKMLVALATVTGEVLKLFRFEHPTETGEFLRIVAEVRAGVEGGNVVVAMEPTGTYGDAIRLRVVEAGVRVFMVSPKRTHDSKELFDGVPSLHDAKSAVQIARLHAMGLSMEWKPPPPMRPRLRALVDLRQHEQRRGEECHGRLEGALARHWPELGQWADVREQKSALSLLAKYPSPARVAADPEGAKALLREASHGRLSAEAMGGVIAGAQGSLGVPMTPEEERLVQTLATQVLEASKHMTELEREMQALGKDEEVYTRLRTWMGTVTAAVMVTMCDPLQYAGAYQLEKGIGINLREKSSGQTEGRLSITKRGPGLVRQMLYLFALRMIQADAVVRAWYERRQGHTDQSRLRAVVAVMRKLARAMFHVARGSAFDASKLFDVRRLGLDSPKAQATTEQSVAGPTVAASKEVTSATAPAPTETSASAPLKTSASVPTETTAAMTSASAPLKTSASVPTETTAAMTSAPAPTETSMPALKTNASAPTETSMPALKTSAPATETSMPAPKSLTARTTPRPIARDKTRAKPTPAASKELSTPAPKRIAAAPTKKSTAAPSSSAPPSTVASSSAAPEDSRPAAANAVSVSTARESAVPREEMSASAPMSLAEVQAAAKAAADACVGAAPSGASSKAVLPRTTPRPIARDKRRAQPVARAST